jgi:uncharacterized protein YhaN
MIIKSIYIDNYGQFSDCAFEGFGSGVNVIYGPNEQGKTTVLEFVRRIFFGFPNKKYTGNRYEPVNGNKPGGRLVCELDNGEAIIIERSGVTKGGALKVTYPDGRVITDQNELNSVLHAGEKFYRNVYAVTIEELYSVESLGQEEIKNRIYGAGLDLGGVSLSQIQKYFHDQAEAIFKPRGQNQKIAVLKNELQDIEDKIKTGNESLMRFEDIRNEQKQLENEISEIKSEAKLLENSLNDLKRKCGAYSDFIRYEEAKTQLAQIPAGPDITSEDLDEFKDLTNKLTAAQEALNKNRISQERLHKELAELKCNDELLGLGTEITSLERASERFRADSLTLKEQHSQINELRIDISDIEKIIGKTWTDEKVPEGFVFDIDLKGRVSEFKRRFDELSQQKMAANNIVEMMSQTGSRILPVKLINVMCIFAGIVGVLLVGAGLIGKQYNLIWLGAFSFVLTVVGVISSKFFIRSSPNTPAGVLDRLGKQREMLDAEWNDLRKAIRIKDSVSPENLLECGEELQRFNILKRQLSKLETESVGREEWLKGIESKVQKVFEAVPELKSSGDVPADIAVISQKYRENENLKRERELMLKKSSDIDDDSVEIKAEIENLENAVKRFAEKNEAADLALLKTLHENSCVRKSLNDKLNELKIRLKEVFGIEADFAEIHDSFKSFSMSESESRIAELGRRLDDLFADLAERNQRMGALAKEQENLISGDDLVNLRNRQEQTLQKLHDAAVEWAEYTVAEKLLRKAINKYERERQPEVISKASNIFSSLSDGRYSHIMKPADSDDLIIVGKQGETRSVIELSRGTREQLYLSMRMGLIEQYEAQSEKLPVVFDDIFVNFDNIRLENAIEAVFDFARERQVLLLTCHTAIRDKLLAKGAHSIVM